MAYHSQIALLDYSNLTSTAEVVSSSSPLELHCLSALKMQRHPFFSSPVSQQRPKGLALPSGSSTLRVWLPSPWRQLRCPWEPISAPCALRLFPSELFSLPGVEKVFPLFLSALALSYKTLPGLASALQRFHPPGKAAPLY